MEKPNLDDHKGQDPAVLKELASVGVTQEIIAGELSEFKQAISKLSDCHQKLARKSRRTLQNRKAASRCRGKTRATLEGSQDHLAAWWTVMNPRNLVFHMAEAVREATPGRADIEDLMVDYLRSLKERLTPIYDAAREQASVS